MRILPLGDVMQPYDPLVEIPHVAEQPCELLGQVGKSDALQNLQKVLREDADLRKEIQKRMAANLATTVVR